MNFIKKKPPQPITTLRSIFANATNTSIQCYEHEKNNDVKKAYQGWKGLHTSLLYELDAVTKSYSIESLSNEENSLYFEIKYLNNKAKENMGRLEVLLIKELSELNKSFQGSGSHASNSANNSLTHTTNPFQPQPQLVLLLQLQQPRRMLKTLRSPKLSNESSSSSSNSKFHSSRHANNYSSPSLISKTAANRIWKEEEGKSLKNTGKKDDAAFPTDLFKDFSDINDANDFLSPEKSPGKGSAGSINTINAGHHTQPSLVPPVPPPSRKHQTNTDSTTSKFNKISLDPLGSKKSPTSSFAKSPLIGSSKSQAHSHSEYNVQQAKIVRPIRPAKSSSSVKPKIITSTYNSSPTKPGPSAAALRASKLSAAVTQRAKNPQVSRPAVSQLLQKAKKSAHHLSVAKPDIKKTHSAPNTRTSSPKLPSQPNYRGGTSSATTKSKSTKTPVTRSMDLKTKNISDDDEIDSDEKDTETIMSDNDDNDEKVDLKDTLGISEAEVQEAMQNRIITEIKGIDKDAAKQIFNEIVDQGDEVHWEDIAGLEVAKASLKEAVVYPFLRPDLFSGLREPARGMLLFGPPGTGKTMLAKAVATESKSTFFSISASSLTSKYLGESEKLVRALFLLAKKLSPSIIFVDEIDSLLSARSDNENESSRRIKTEFLIQWNDLSHAAVGLNRKTGSKDEQPRVLVLAATNMPWNIDEAARRRFVRRQYIPLPEPETRRAQFVKMLQHQHAGLTEPELEQLVAMTDGFSGSDITALTKDAAMNPLRELGEQLLFTPKDEIRGLELRDFQTSLQYIRPSVSKEGLSKFADWASKYGSSGA